MGTATGLSNSALTTPTLVALDIPARDHDDVLRQPVDRIVADDRVSDSDGFRRDVLDGTTQSITGLPNGRGLAHAHSRYLTVPCVAIARVPRGVDFGGADGPATLVCLVAAPMDRPTESLRILTILARQLFKDSFVTSLHTAVTPAAAAGIIISEFTDADLLPSAAPELALMDASPAGGAKVLLPVPHR